MTQGLDRTAVDGASDVALAISDLKERLPEPLAPLAEIAYDYRWSWLPEGPGVFAAVDPDRWEWLNNNPIRLLQETSTAHLRRASANQPLLHRAATVLERMRADREVGDDADVHARPPGRPLRRRELIRGQPLQPGVEADPVGQPLPEPGDLGRPGVGQGRGPRPPVRTVHLGQGTPGRPVADRAVAGEEGIPLGPAAAGQRDRVDQLERGQLGRPDRVPVDQRRAGARRAQRAGQRLHPGPVAGAQALVLGDVLDAQVQRADLAAAHRQVGGGADRRPRFGRVQRVHQHEVRAQLTAAPGGQVGQVVQVAVTPGSARAHRV